MIKIIIVDDDQKQCVLVKQIIKPLLFKYDETFRIISFSSFNSELQNLISDNSERKVFLLDIDLGKKITGINIAQIIRKKDWDSEIIFFTNHDHYFNKVYRSVFKVFDFIEKFDHMEDRLIIDLEKIFSHKHDNGMYKYKNNQINLTIYLKDILYIYRETDERKLIIKTTNNKFKISKTFDEILSELDLRFKKVHRGCIVNTSRVSRYDWNNGDFILDTSEKVHLLSKKYKQEVEQCN